MSSLAHDALETRSEPYHMHMHMRAGLWTWSLLAAWLLYSAAMLAWYVMNDPEIINAICRTRP